MFGKRTSPALGLHAAETNGFIVFCSEHLLPRYGAALGSRKADYELVLGSMCRIIDLIRKHKREATPAMRQSFCKQVSEHLLACGRLELPCIRKHHMMVEVAARLHIYI